MEKIAISMISKQNRQMLGDLLRNDYELIDFKPEGYDEDFSLLIIDLPSWIRNKKQLQKIKEKEKPIFLPYLLVSSANDLKIADKEVWESFDEVITTPITKAQLIARVKVLLQSRNLSLQVNQLLKDKEMLIKEIHHRVKNNLMVISSLLNLQSRYIKDEEARDIFKDSQNRAKSMALIHERLYRSSDLKKIEFGEYIRSLTNDLFETYVTDKDKIQLKIEIGELDIDINTSIPLGLIINELVSNCLKYAFPGDKTGYIRIKLHRDGENYILEVSDNGVGFPEDLDFQRTESLGMQLVNNLTLQLRGKVELIKSPGTTFTITFPEERYG